MLSAFPACSGEPKVGFRESTQRADSSFGSSRLHLLPLVLRKSFSKAGEHMRGLKPGNTTAIVELSIGPAHHGSYLCPLDNWSRPFYGGRYITTPI